METDEQQEVNVSVVKISIFDRHWTFTGPILVYAHAVLLSAMFAAFVYGGFGMAPSSLSNVNVSQAVFLATCALFVWSIAVTVRTAARYTPRLRSVKID